MTERIADVLFGIVVALLLVVLWVGVYKHSVIMIATSLTILTLFGIITLWFKTGD